MNLRIHGTGSINGMNQATLAPLKYFLLLYHVPESHKNHIPFPQSGTIRWCFQIVRSIHSEFQKVKDTYSVGWVRFILLRPLLA